MEVIRLKERNLEETVARAAEVLRAGGVILYPTDTLYGLGADALSDEAVAKVYAIKGREERKPIHAIVADIKMAEKYGEVNDSVRTLARELPRGQLTFIVKKRSDLKGGIANGIDTFGFRIPDNDFCTALLREFEGPITTTSANKSEERPERSALKILAQLGDAARHIDLVIDAGELPERKPSTVVDVSSDKVVILREGAISPEEIYAAIRGYSFQ